MGLFRVGEMVATEDVCFAGRFAGGDVEARSNSLVSLVAIRRENFGA
jgi:hypothetical protein